MLEFAGLILGITWLILGLFEGKLIALFRSYGARQYRLILKGTGYASAGVMALYSSTLSGDTALITLIFAGILFLLTWIFLRHIGSEQKVKSSCLNG